MSKKITESDSLHSDLEQQSTRDLLEAINTEDLKVALAVQKIIPHIEKFVELLLPRFEAGGRLFYIGAGTSGRLGVLDASEIPPTFGLAPDRVIGLIAGGDGALRQAVENAEDDPDLSWKDLEKYGIHSGDSLVGLACSGTTPYVIGGLQKAKQKGILTAAITNNPGSPITEVADISLVAEVGPEFVTGSTRMKGGTSQKLILNMISTTLMIRTGRVQGNKMVHMQLNNKKLEQRAIRMITKSLHVTEKEAQNLLQRHRSVAAVLENHTTK